MFYTSTGLPFPHMHCFMMVLLEIQFSGVQIFVKSCRGSSELIFVVLNFVTPEARYAITD